MSKEVSFYKIFAACFMALGIYIGMVQLIHLTVGSENVCNTMLPRANDILDCQATREAATAIAGDK